MTFREYVELAASLLTIGSIMLNIVQFRESGSLKRIFEARVQGSFNHFCQIGDYAKVAADTARLNADQEDLRVIFGKVKQIHGVANAARADLTAFSRTMLNFVPQYDPVRTPKADLRSE
jgi:hypothetical protein